MADGLSAEAERLTRHLRELSERQWAFERSTINLIASDNAVPRERSERPVYPGHIIQEGLPEARPFAGAALHDEIELLGERLLALIFGLPRASMQPHSCSQANQAAYHALLEPGDTVASLRFSAGGHLTHGLSSNFSGRHYRFVHFGVTAAGELDFEEVEDMLRRHPVKLVVLGGSGCPRLFDVARLRTRADAHGAHLLLDLSHEAGLIAAGAIPNPCAYADVVTMSLDKTLRGPFGAAILCREEFARAVRRAVHPARSRASQCDASPIRSRRSSRRGLPSSRRTGPGSRSSLGPWRRP